MNLFQFVLWSLLVFAVLIVVSLIANRYPKKFIIVRSYLFWTITLFILAVSLFLIIFTVYKNVYSETKGPVHWHADFEIYNCGERVELIDPFETLSNKVGTSLFHEHNDNRIHIEGAVPKLQDISLSSFFEIVGGKLTENELIVPTNNEPISRTNGEDCNGQKGEIQVFIYKTNNNAITQEKISNYQDYILSPYAYVPKGDCIIIEFDNKKDSTEIICNTIEIALEKGDYSYGG